MGTSALNGSYTYGTAPPPPPPSPSSSNVTQYITHDGDAVGNVQTSSAPNRLYWNTALRFKWANAGMGDWLDSALTSQGTSPYASSAAVTTDAQRLTMTVTALVSRWLTTGVNRGFYLAVRGNAWPLTFAGRTAATTGDRPVLTVVTSAGTFNLTARANASWNGGNVNVSSSAAQWTVAQGAQPAILQFDLSSITGTLTSATLACTAPVRAVNGSGIPQTGHILDVYEANPPTFVVPDTVSSPTLGIAADYASWDAMRIAAPSTLKFCRDMAAGDAGIDSGFMYSPAFGDTYTPQRATNPITGTTYARVEFIPGKQMGISRRIDVTKGTGTNGTPDVVYDELHGQISMWFGPNMCSSTNDDVKLPAMSCQFGYWNSTTSAANPFGYWQSTTGNGGSPGTGLKVWNATQGKWEYQGHSMRLNALRACTDTSAYSDLLGLYLYAYHLDQVGATGDVFEVPLVAVRRSATANWYTFSHRMKLNTMSGAQDADGNYATANDDGEYQIEINGLTVFNKTNFRWRRHAEIGAQNIWLDGYHGGTSNSNATMHVYFDKVSVSTVRVGPDRVAPIQLTGSNWTPNVDGSGNVQATDFPQLPQAWVYAVTNKIDDLVPAGLYPSGSRYANVVSGADGLHSVIGAWSGAAWDWINGRMYVSGGGHADSFGTENGVFCFDSTTMRWTLPVPRGAYTDARWWDGTNVISGTSGSGNNYPQANGGPPAMHTYHAIRWVPGTRFGGNTRGYFIQHFPGEVKGGIAIADLDTGTWKPAWFNAETGTDKDLSYATAWVEWPYMLSPGFGSTSMFGGYLFNLSGTQSTTYNAASQGQYVSTFTGLNAAYNNRANCQMEARREMVNFGNHAGSLVINRYRLGAAVDAGSQADLTAYVDSITLTGDTGDFTASAFNENTVGARGLLWEAGIAYDSDADCLWMVPTAAGAAIYKITGLNGTTWTVTKYATGTTLQRNPVTTDNGTYGRVRCFKRGGIRFLMRVSSTTSYTEVRRCPDN